MITDLFINNFKSLKSVYLKTKKVNLFIGYPNVGKSNVLEAMSLLSPSQPSHRFMDGYIRYDDVENLFYENDPSEPIIVATNVGAAYINKLNIYSDKFTYGLLINELPTSYISNLAKKKPAIWELMDMINSEASDVDPEDFFKIGCTYNLYVNGVTDLSSKQTSYHFAVSITEIDLYIKKYDFRPNDTFKIKFPDFLLPPFGENLFSIFEANEELYNDINQLLAGNDLELVLRVKERKLEVQRKKGAKVYAFPYTSIADTIQRLAFYLAAIYSNKNSVLLFEEPEAHSFPPFVQMLASRIAADNSNQYFITTHSPYIFDTLLEQLGKDEIAVHVCSYQDDQTHIRTLSSEELANVQNMREEIFFNLEKYS